MIEISGVTYRYPGGEQPALRNLSLIVPDGQFLAVVGANSAGKTSLANLVAGFIPHFYHGTLEGTVSLDGEPTGEQSLAEIMQSVGYVFQNPYNQISGARFSVREEIAFGLENLGVPVEVMEQHVAEAMQVTGISALAERSPLALSGGQMQRVAIASILAMQPRILILDEPTAQLDPAGSREVFAAVRGLMQNRPMTVIMIEHKVEWLAEYADRLIVLAEGALVADGAPREVLADERLMQFGVGLTRYTRAAFLARAAGWWPPGRRAAVTLDEAVDGMRAAGVGVGGA